MQAIKTVLWSAAGGAVVWWIVRRRRPVRWSSPIDIDAGGAGVGSCEGACACALSAQRVHHLLPDAIAAPLRKVLVPYSATDRVAACPIGSPCGEVQEGETSRMSTPEGARQAAGGIAAQEVQMCRCRR